MSLVNAGMQVKHWFIQKNAVKKFRGNAFDTSPGYIFDIQKNDFDNSQNLVQILLKSYLKNWKNFSQNYNAPFQIPPSYAILYSKIREKLFSKFDLNFVRICLEKLIKNFRTLTKHSKQSSTYTIYCFLTRLWLSFPFS